MPLVRSIDRLADGFRIIKSDGTSISLASADIPSATKSQGSSAVQTWVNSWLTQQGYNGACRVRTVTPLGIDVVIAKAGIDASKLV
jgi:uncharacterized protein (UPF0264 family)